jgi:CheY-like chemotaxis protein
MLEFFKKLFHDDEANKEKKNNVKDLKKDNKKNKRDKLEKEIEDDMKEVDLLKNQESKSGSKEEISHKKVEFKEETKRKNVHLICDDAFSNRLVLKKYLTMYGCEIDEAMNGQDAIEMVKKYGEYNIIWMDIKMPLMDGFDSTKFLRNNLGYKGVIIGLTGYVDDVTIKKCYDLGMNHMVSKPFDNKIIFMYTEKYGD